MILAVKQTFSIYKKNARLTDIQTVTESELVKCGEIQVFLQFAH